MSAVHDVISFVSGHGYLAIGLIVLAEALGFPLPAALALIAGGAAVAAHALNGPTVVLVALAAMFLGDSVLYWLGRRTGWALLGVLCKISANPETCILRSAESFYKRGKITLVVAKFVPGINTMAPPLAGSMRMSYQQFAGLDLVGVALYVLAYGALGFAFRDFVAIVVSSFQAAGRVLEILILLAFLGYLTYRVWLFSRHRVYQVVPRVQVEELVRKLQSDAANRILVVDVRSHGYYDPAGARIQGSVRIEPNNLAEEIKALPREREIYVYCT